MLEAAVHGVGLLALAASLGWLLPALWFLARFRAPSLPEEGRVTLLLCTTGRNPHLPALFAALAAQTLPPRRLVVAVESEADPAFAQVAELAPALPFPVETVIAGTAPHRSQKATSLIAAARRVDEEDQAVVLLDADILPPPDWLSWLASPAIRGSWDIVSGYRWQLARQGGPARQFVTWLDRGFAIGPRQMLFRQVWGGSTAISAAAFARLDLPATLDRTLSTDGAISRRANALGLRMLMRRSVLLPTPAEGGERGALGFERRQISSSTGSTRRPPTPLSAPSSPPRPPGCCCCRRRSRAAQRPRHGSPRSPPPGLPAPRCTRPSRIASPGRSRRRRASRKRRPGCFRRSPRWPGLRSRCRCSARSGCAGVMWTTR